MLTALLATTLLLLSLEFQQTAVLSASVKMRKDIWTTPILSETFLVEAQGDMHLGRSATKRITHDMTEFNQVEVNSYKHAFQSIRLPVTDKQYSELREPNTFNMSTLLKNRTQSNRLRVEDMSTLLKLFPKSFRNNLFYLNTTKKIQHGNFVLHQRLKRQSDFIQTSCGELTPERCGNITRRMCVSICVNGYTVRVCRRHNGCSIYRNTS